jgi:hypothetical protein
MAYHDRTKHHLQRYALGPCGLDWATQPNPFRRFDGSPVLKLPLADAAGAGYIIPVHHQTFKLSDEPPQEGIERLQATMSKEPERLAIRRIG